MKRILRALVLTAGLAGLDVGVFALTRGRP
jgi:hypothetical protein